MNNENDNEKEYYGKIDGKRLKPIELHQAINIMSTDWKPYELSGEQVPNFLKMAEETREERREEDLELFKRFNLNPQDLRDVAKWEEKLNEYNW